MRATNPLIGKTITKIEVTSDGHAIKFSVDEGDPVIAWCDADCCSHTWIEALDDPDAVIGSPVLSAEPKGDMPEGDQPDYDCIQFYGFEIATARGRCVIDYRNESNGYYGGSLEWDMDDFYGGVWKQNVDNADWGAPPTA